MSRFHRFPGPSPPVGESASSNCLLEMVGYFWDSVGHLNGMRFHLAYRSRGLILSNTADYFGSLLVWIFPGADLFARFGFGRRAVSTWWDVTLPMGSLRKVGGAISPGGVSQTVLLDLLSSGSCLCNSEVIGQSLTLPAELLVLDVSLLSS